MTSKRFALLCYKDNKETPETFNTCDLPTNFFEVATKKTFEPTKENLNIEENLRVIKIKFLTFNYWSSQTEKLTAAVKIFLLT